MSEPADTQQDTGPSPARHERFQLVTFGVAGEEFAVDILAVQEINRMMPLRCMPQTPPELEGVINLRGRTIPVMDLRKRIGLGVRERNDHNRIIVVEVDGRVIGLIVDRVHEVLSIPGEIVDPTPPMNCPIDSDLIAGVCKLEDRLIFLLDVQRLFSDDLVAAADSAVANAA